MNVMFTYDLSSNFFTGLILNVMFTYDLSSNFFTGLILNVEFTMISTAIYSQV